MMLSETLTKQWKLFSIYSIFRNIFEKNVHYPFDNVKIEKNTSENVHFY